MARKKNTRLDELRAEVRRAHELATRKVQRNENKGVQLEGSKYDPRRDRSVIGRYNSTQLNSYLKTLNSFRSRKNQFYKGAKGAPLPSAQWREYAKIQNRVNAKQQKIDSQFADIMIDNSGMTVAERMQRISSDSTGRNPAANSIFSKKLTRVPENVASEQALRKLIQREQRKLDPGYIAKTVKEGRKAVRTFMMTAGRYDLMEDLNKLTDKQFHLLWQYTNLGEVGSLGYELAKSRLMPDKDDRGSRWEAKVADDSFKDVEKLVKWAGTVR